MSKGDDGTENVEESIVEQVDTVLSEFESIVTSKGGNIQTGIERRFVLA